MTGWQMVRISLLTFKSLCVVFGLAALTGCGVEKHTLVKVSGTVLLDGKPLESGSIQVVPANGRAASAQLGPGGRFTLGTYTNDDGVQAGTHKVSIVSVEELNKTSRRWNAPQEYVDIATSGLEVTIDEPRDDLEISITYRGKKPVVETYKAEL